MGVPQANLGSGGYASAISAMLAERAAQYATPQQLPQIQHSAYLAQALQALTKSGSEGLRSPKALWGNLAAEALLAYASNKANKNVAAMDASNWANISRAGESMLPPDQPSPPAPGAPGPGAGGGAMASAPPPQPAQAPAAAQAPPSPAPGPQLSDADKGAVANAVYGEARGEPAEGQIGVADVILNRARALGLSPAEVVAQPHQFAGYNPSRRLSPEQQQKLLSAIAPALAGQDITGGADHFFNPALAHPSWGAGPGQMIGNHKFMALNDMGAHPASGAALPAAATAAPTPQPLQVATGPGPSVPAPNPGAPVPPAPANSAPQGAAPSSPQWPLGPVPIQPEQRHRLDQLRSMAQAYPQFRQQYMQELQQLQDQTSKGEPFDQQVVNGQQILTGKITGRTVTRPLDALQFHDEAGAPPNVNIQRGPDNQLRVNELHNYGPIPQGGRINPDGSITAAGPTTRVLTPAEVVQKGYAPGSVVEQNTLTGETNVRQQPQIDAKALQASRDSFRNNDDVKKANEGIAAYNGLTSALAKMTKNSGVLDTAAVDSYLRGINPGMGAKNTTVSMFLNHLGFSQEVQSFIQSHIKDEGYLTPRTLHQMLDVIHSYAGAHVAIAQNWANQDLQAFKPFGVTAEQLGENLTPFAAMPNVRWMQQQPAPAAHQQNHLAPEHMSRAQLEAEAQRLGLRKGVDY